MLRPLGPWTACVIDFILLVRMQFARKDSGSVTARIKIPSELAESLKNSLATSACHIQDDVFV